MKTLSKLFVALIIICATTSQANAKTIKALFLGNSYTQFNNLPEIIKQLALSAGDTLIYNSNTPGGYTLEQHSTNATSLSLIANGGWDFVILQEQSQKPSFPNDFVASEVYPFAAKLDSLIHLSSPCATTLFYVTWGRKNGDGDNCDYFAPLCTYEGMDSMLQLRYTIMAQDNKAAISPVAMVWRKLRTDFPSIELYNPDESHPSANGSFAAACAFYTMMFQKNPMLSTYNFSISSANANDIKQVTKNLVYDSMAYWNRFAANPIASFNFTTSENTVTFNNTSVNADSYHWDFGDGNTDNTKNPVHTYSTLGDFLVTLTVNKNGCEHSITSQVNIMFTDINNVDKNNTLSIYPNPVTNKMYIQLKNTAAYKIAIKDVQGKDVRAIAFYGNKYNVHVGDLPKGIYVLQIKNEQQGIITKKFAVD